MRFLQRGECGALGRGVAVLRGGLVQPLGKVDL